jgi:hypothetical protein
MPFSFFRTLTTFHEAVRLGFLPSGNHILTVRLENEEEELRGILIRRVRKHNTGTRVGGRPLSPLPTRGIQVRLLPS